MSGPAVPACLWCCWTRTGPELILLSLLPELKPDQITSECSHITEPPEFLPLHPDPSFLFAPATCFSHRGRSYQGAVNVTRSGTPCQPWNQQVIRTFRSEPEPEPTKVLPQSSLGNGC